MISTTGAKSPDLIRRIQEHEEDPKALEGLFNLKEIQQIQSIAEESYLSEEHTQKKLLSASGKALGNMAQPQGRNFEILEEMISSKIRPFVQHEFKMAFSFHRNYFPYGTHTDSGYDDTEWIYKQGIIPLEVDPDGAEVFTVIFKQKAYHSISYPGKLETIQALRPEELKHIEGLDPNKTLSSEELGTLFQGEADKERFRGFEVALPFRWRIGDMALWDRAHLHCSSDFENHGIKGKLGLMWISWRV